MKELPPPAVTCCYCGREFTISQKDWGRKPWEYLEERIEIQKITTAMLDDGLPLECGQCRKVGNDKTRETESW